MPTNLESIRELLESRLKDAIRTEGSRESIRIQQVADPVDMTMQAAERELAVHSLDRNAALARQLRAAIVRIHDGTYGLCRECEEEIAPKRLKAIPWAQLCIQCQEAADGQVCQERDFGMPADYREAA